MATGLYPFNADSQRIYTATLLPGVDGFSSVPVPAQGICCGIRAPKDLLLSIVILIDDDFFLFTGKIDEVYVVLTGLMMIGKRRATPSEIISAIRASIAQSATISLSATEFKCRYVVNDRTVRVFQRKDRIENLLMNGAVQIVFAGDGSKIFVGA